MDPIIAINFKTYEGATGEKAVKLAKIIAKTARKKKAKVILIVQSTDVYTVSKSVGVDVYSQSVDPVIYGAYTGYVLPEAVKQAGAKGTLLNHSEKKIPLGTLKAAAERAKSAGLKVMCCASDVDEAEDIAAFEPDYLAFEDPDLIGTGRSISQEQPTRIRQFVETLRRIKPKIKLLCGAGISTGVDVKTSLGLGVDGVLLASAVAKAKNPEKVMKDLTS